MTTCSDNEEIGTSSEEDEESHDYTFYTNQHRSELESEDDLALDILYSRTFELEKTPRAVECTKPEADELKQDSVRLIWDHPENRSKEGVDQYQIRYRIKNDTNLERWKSIFSGTNRNNAVISGLKSDTTYEFQVRPVYTECPYSIVSDPVKTLPSLAYRMLDFSTKIQDSAPDKVAVYRLNSTEIQDTINSTTKIRKIVVGEENEFITKEKTIMVVGGPGSGKSTMVDAIVNYLLGVNFDDTFRFKLVTPEEEGMNQSSPVLSKTDWITSYTIHPLADGGHDFKINIIDTPAFGDKRGIDRDTDIVRQIKELFSADGPMGVPSIDAVCFLVKASDARLTVAQKYIFHSIELLFGNDISQNICTLVTFADGNKTPVLIELEKSGLPFGEWFPFNNSGLFVQNENLHSTSCSPMFWAMGHKSFNALFEHIESFETKGLKLTEEVPDQREYIQSVIDTIQPRVNLGLHRLNELDIEIDVLQIHKTEIECSGDIEYTVEETRQVKTELEPGHHVTNCMICIRTCHRICSIPNDDGKARCWAMDSTGYCRICPKNCHWSNHKNTKYIIDYETVRVTKRFQETMKKYVETAGKQLTHGQLLLKIRDELWIVFHKVLSMMVDVNESRQRLMNEALISDPVSISQHIDQMIQAEEMEKSSGFNVRIEMLKGMRNGEDGFKAALEMREKKREKERRRLQEQERERLRKQQRQREFEREQEILRQRQQEQLQELMRKCIIM